MQHLRRLLQFHQHQPFNLQNHPKPPQKKQKFAPGKMGSTGKHANKPP
jgi:hypothetical protein